MMMSASPLSFSDLHSPAVVVTLSSNWVAFSGEARLPFPAKTKLYRAKRLRTELRIQPRTHGSTITECESDEPRRKKQTVAVATKEEVFALSLYSFSLCHAGRETLNNFGCYNRIWEGRGSRFIGHAKCEVRCLLRAWTHHISCIWTRIEKYTHTQRLPANLRRVGVG